MGNIMNHNYHQPAFLYYLNNLGPVIKVKVVNGRVKIYSSDTSVVKPLTDLIESYATGVELSIKALGLLLNKISQSEALLCLGKGDVVVPRKSGRKVNIDNIEIFPSKSMPSVPITVGATSLNRLYKESLNLDLTRIPFVDKFLPDDLTVIVDTSEPIELYELFQQSVFPSDNVFRDRLPIGDIKVISSDTLDELIIERKSISDLKSGILNEHCHDQVERYADYVRDKAADGITVKLYWIFESEENGNKGMFNCLQKIENMEGWFGYSFGISDQPIHQTFSLRHTCYSICKMSQCYFERELFYKLKSANHKANRKKSNRAILTREREHSGVFRREDNLAGLIAATGVPVNVSVELASIGKQFNEVTLMSRDELMAVKGVGAKIADQILGIFTRQA
jgi:ERCC4-type nuclease